MQANQSSIKQQRNRFMAFGATRFRKLITEQRSKKEKAPEMGAFQYIA